MLVVSELVRVPIDPRALEAQIRTDACGGIVTFLGVVRERAQDGRRVTGLSYESHDVMALDEFETIAAEVQSRYAGMRLGIIHRLGEIPVGEIAVAVCAASAHRAQAFEACAYAIDELKDRAPIWKKEHYADGTGEWIANSC